MVASKGGLSPEARAWFENYVAYHKEEEEPMKSESFSMSKSDALSKIRQLEELQEETARKLNEMRNLISKPHIKHKYGNVYIGLSPDGTPYILIGIDDKYRFCGPQKNSNRGWTESEPTAQDAIDVNGEDLEIHEFGDAKEAFKFFTNHLK